MAGGGDASISRDDIMCANQSQCLLWSAKNFYVQLDYSCQTHQEFDSSPAKSRHGPYHHQELQFNSLKFVCLQYDCFCLELFYYWLSHLACSEWVSEDISCAALNQACNLQTPLSSVVPNFSPWLEQFGPLHGVEQQVRHMIEYKVLAPIFATWNECSLYILGGVIGATSRDFLVKFVNLVRAIMSVQEFRNVMMIRAFC